MNLSASLSGNLPVGRRTKLLIVDDQPLNIQVLYQLFSKDHQVFMATNGAQALALSASQQPDLILLDIVMPDMDGYEVCSRLKADPLTREIPVIFVTAHTDEASEEHGLDVGAVDFISKPVNPKIVRARVATHITLKKQSDLLRSWAYIDGLTGVNNRRYFDEQLGMEWARAERNKTGLAALLIDVDFFKRYNDHYGHQMGDDCLRRVATAIKASLRRPADQVARYGGEEFVCLLPDTELEGVLRVAEQIRCSVEQLQIAHADSPSSARVTVSVGGCTKLAGQDGAPEELIHQADAQLYAAKHDGRNRVRCAELVHQA
ncbi:MAG: diguanylate cyclase response regulator [Burkholderiales bacterium PBB4]|nr:MAG: diguanylate cyclase response regulator [Burkholderiales bacterium PBB4]